MQATGGGTGEVWPGTARGRLLQQAAPVVTPVTTGQELIDAVIAGAQHIRIEQHLDLTLTSLDDQIHPISDDDSTGSNLYRYAGYVDASRTNTIMVGPYTPACRAAV